MSSCISDANQSEHFAHMTGDLSTTSPVNSSWPCLADASPMLGNLVNLNSEKRFHPGGERNTEWQVTESVALVTAGEAEAVDGEGATFKRLSEGDCFNEQVLLGANGFVGTLRPSAGCGVMTLPLVAWDKIIAEFQEQHEDARRSIKKFIFSSAEKRAGATGGGVELLLRSALFRNASADFTRRARAHLQDKIYEAGDEILGGTQHSDAYMILLDGSACVVEGTLRTSVSAVQVFGESQLVGARPTHTSSIVAVTQCLVQILAKSDFEAVMMQCPVDKRKLNEFRKRMRALSGGWLQRGLLASRTFAESCPEFLTLLCKAAEDRFYAPEEVILTDKEAGVDGNSPLTLLLVGQVTFESELGVCVGTANAIDVFGWLRPGGATQHKRTWVCASKEGLVYCLKLPGPLAQEAFKAFPDEMHRLSHLYARRQATHAILNEVRESWLIDTAVPNLAQIQIFKNCSKKFLLAVAIRLCEQTRNCGKTLVFSGQPADSLVVILDGEVALEAVSGEQVGVVTKGAVFGLVSMLGLFPTRTVTLRAQSACTFLEVPMKALQEALREPGTGTILESLRSFRSRKQAQVERGLPLTMLPIDAAAEEVGVRAVALLADRLDLGPGDTWVSPTREATGGTHFVVFVHGRANLEMKDTVWEEGRLRERHYNVVTLGPGSMLCGSLAEEFGAYIRVRSDCEAYLVHHHDLTVSKASAPSSQQWLHRFKLFEHEVSADLRARLESMKAFIEGRAQHPRDDTISEWRDKKARLARRATRLRDLKPSTSEDGATKEPLAAGTWTTVVFRSREA